MFAARRLREAPANIIIPGTITVNPSGQTTASQVTWGASGGTMALGNNVTATNGVLTVLSSNSNATDTFSALTGCGVTSAQKVSNAYAGMWWGNGSSGGAKTLTITDTSSQWTGLAVEIAGIVGGPMLTVSDPGTGVSTTLTITPTHIGQFVVFAVVGNNAGSATLSGSAGFTTITAGGAAVKLAYQVATTLAPLTATWTAASVSSLGALFQ